eukprot:152690_1
MLSKKSDGNIACCFDSFEIYPIVAIYGLLWYMNSIYGVIVMIVESQNVCFFEWYPVCIVNAMIPILWLIIIAMVDSCCVKFWSLKKWHRRHYGAAFLYFAIFTNQTLIFGTLCVYGFVFWSTIASPPCDASDHLQYGFMLMICTSTTLILWIGCYQFYAATKYLCTYTAVLEVKKRQQNSNNQIQMNGKTNKNGSNGSNSKTRKMSIESQSIVSEVNISKMSFSFIGSIFRYGDEPELDFEDGIEIDIGHEDDNHNNTSILELKLSDNTSYQNEFDHHKQPNDVITPFPSQIRESAQLMDYIHDKNNENNDDEELKLDLDEISESRSQTPSLSQSVTQSHIEIAGISIPYAKKFSLTPRYKKKQHDHKQYNSVQNEQREQTIEIISDDHIIKKKKKNNSKKNEKENL